MRLSSCFTIGVLCLTLAFGTSGCRFFRKGSFTSSADSKSLREREIDRLGQEFRRIEELFPQQEFKDIAKEIYNRFATIYSNPEVGLRQPALIYVLTSLPGTGKTKFVEEVARALKAAGRSNFRQVEMSPHDLYLDFSLVRELGSSQEDIASIRGNRSEVKPIVLHFDEYTLAATGSLTNSAGQSINQRLAAFKQQLLNSGLEDKLSSLTNVVNDIRNRYSSSSDHDERTALNDAYHKLNNQTTSLRETYNESVEELSSISSDSKKSVVTENLKKADENFTVLWQILGNGTIPKKVLTNRNNLGPRLRSAADEIAGKLTKKERERLELKVLNERLSRIEDQIKSRQDELTSQSGKKPSSPTSIVVEDSNIEISNSGNQSSEYAQNANPKNDSTLKDLLRDKQEIESALSTLLSQLGQTEAGIESIVRNLRDVMQELTEAYGVSVFEEAANALAIEPSNLTAQEIEQIVADIASRNKLSTDNVREIARFEMSRLSEFSSVASPVERLLDLFRSRPQLFAQYYEAQLATRPPDKESDRFAGATVIFLTGNVLQLQERAIALMGEKGETICSDLSNGKGSIAYFRNPDCLRRIAEIVAKDERTQRELDDAIKAVLGQKIYDYLGEEGKDRPSESNSLAFKSRIGKSRFILPAGSEDYRNFLRKDLDNLASDFQNRIGVPVNFDSSVIDKLLYPKYVNAFLGFRDLGSKAASEFRLTLDGTIARVITALRAAEEVGDKKCNIQSVVNSTRALNISNPKAPDAIEVQVVSQANGAGNVEVVYSAVFGGQRRVLLRVPEGAFENAAIKSHELTPMEKLSYALYLGGVYGSIAVLMQTLPSEPVALQPTLSGAPVSAVSVIPSGYDFRDFRLDLQYASIEIQSYIAGLAAMSALNPLHEPPREYDARVLNIKFLIEILHAKLMDLAARKRLTPEQLLTRDVHNDISGHPVSQSDLLLARLVKLSQPIGALETDRIYTDIHGEFLGLFQRRNDYREAVKQLTNLIATKLNSSGGSAAGDEWVSPAEFEEILRSVDIRPVTAPGAPGIVRCEEYLEMFRRHTIDVVLNDPGRLTAGQEAGAKSLFGAFVRRAQKDIQKVRSFATGFRSGLDESSSERP